MVKYIIKAKKTENGNKIDRHKEIKKWKTLIGVFGISTVAFFAGLGGGYKLGTSNTEKKYTGVTIDEDNTSTDAEKVNGEKTNNGIDSINLRNVGNEDWIFINTKDGSNGPITISGANLDTIKDINLSEGKLKEIISSFKTSDEALNFVKELLVKEYNNEYLTSYNAADVSMYSQKVKEGYFISSDTAENGDEIYRIKQGMRDATGRDCLGIIICSVPDYTEEGAIIKDQDGSYQYVRVYKENEIVKEATKARFDGKTAFHGCDLATALDHIGEIDWTVAQEYKDRVYNAIIDSTLVEINGFLDGYKYNVYGDKDNNGDDIGEK